MRPIPNDRPKYFHPFFSDLPMNLKVLFSMILVVMGLGYLFAMIQIYEVHAGIDGKPGLSVRDIQIAYAGNAEGSRIETALRGPMSSMLPEAEANVIIGWARTGAGEAEFKAEIEPILKERCQGCHNGSDAKLPSLMSYDGAKAVAQTDHGVAIGTLVRVSHIHMFGITFIFSIMGFIFSHAYVRHRYFKSVLIALPFLAIIVDIGSWWLTKVSLVFAYTVFVGGVLMGVSFAVQWFVCAYQIWFLRAPPAGARPD
jgi:hypothetical protein